jgi:histidyl-tRNA synthetase
MALYGYAQVDVPILQPADLFLIKAGDQIANRLFTFDQQGQQWALRPEFTAAAAYYYNGANETRHEIVRWQFSGPVFEDDPNTKDAQNQRYSIGAELIGLDGALADAEIIAMAMRGLDQLGIAQATLTVGHSAFVRQLLQRFDLEARTQRFVLHHLAALRDKSLGQDYVLEQFDRFVAARSHPTGQTDTDVLLRIDDPVTVVGAANEGATVSGQRSREDIVRRLIKRRERAAQRPQVMKALGLLEQISTISGTPDTAFRALREVADNDVQLQSLLRDWETTIEFVYAAGIHPAHVTIQADLARNWEYYTGIVFEMQANNQHLGGGGRYDDLTGLVGGARNVPAVGFAYYVDLLLAALPHDGAERICYTLGMQHDGVISQAITWAERLRSRNIAVRLERAVQARANDLLVLGDGTLAYNRANFTLEQIDSLIMALRGSDS